MILIFAASNPFTMKKLFYILFAVLLTSCLTIERKEYSFEITGEESGILTVKYINIMSMKSDGGDVETDFNELMDNYVDGDLIEKQYPFAKLISKRLYEENGQLCGELKFEFSELNAVKLYQYNQIGPYMLSLHNGSGMEEFTGSNGSYGGDIMPIVFWPAYEQKLKLTTNITHPDKDCVSLLNMYKNLLSEKESVENDNQLSIKN